MAIIRAAAPVFLLMLIPLAIYGQDVDIDRIVEHIQKVNRISDTYSITVDIAVFEPGKDPQITCMRNFVRGLDTVLAVYSEPAKDRGKKILLSEGNMWMYFPKAGRSIIIRPSGALFGAVNTGDILSPPLLDLYELETWKTIGEGDEERLALTFRAITIKAPYGRIVYHYDSHDSVGRILYSECYARSGILLKKAYFSDYIDLDQRGAYASRIRYESAVDPGTYVLIRLSDLKHEVIMDYYFTPEGMKRVIE